MKYGFVAAAALLLSSLAHAELSKGVYVGAGVGTVHSTIATQANRIVGYAAPNERDKSDFGGKLYGGYSWGSLSLEGGYYKLGSYELNGDWYVLDGSGAIIGTTPVSDKFSAKALALSVLYTIPAGESFSFSGRLGVASVKTDYKCETLCGLSNGTTTVANNSTTSAVPVVGLGVSWYITKHIALRGDIESFRGAKFKYLDGSGKANYDLYTVGGEFRF